MSSDSTGDCRAQGSRQNAGKRFLDYDYNVVDGNAGRKGFLPSGLPARLVTVTSDECSVFVARVLAAHAPGRIDA
ncbi:hypothetical protein [Arthrobacter sp. 135MFCol5.1]|uniref:hypothetical protein n=1 Tax=Arthrobacter sp. 135MFCol5.1 TaxID=1158050 RepID=UPI0012DD17A1|nr:hypothetical protein [Arthrobacter sp. 135MFCol5.1]